MTDSAALTLSDVAIGDRLVITPLRGGRYGIKVDQVVDPYLVSGSQFKLSEPNVLFRTRRMATDGLFRRGLVERIS
jgi:hypothetical protein